jgi:hypothetical protein
MAGDAEADDWIPPAECDGCHRQDVQLHDTTSAYWEGDRLLCDECCEEFYQYAMREREGGW